MNQPKQRLSAATLAFAGFSGLALLAYGGPSYGRDSRHADSREERFRKNERRNEDRAAFETGICVGQTLSAAGVTLPTPGQRTELDDATREALDTAIKTCRDEMRNPEPSPSPSASPSPEPTESPNPDDSGTETGTISSSG